MKFIVYYSDNINLVEHIDATTARDAAIKFLMKVPRDDNCQICVEAKHFSNRNEDSIFNTLDILPDIKMIKSRPIQDILDKNIIYDFDILLLEGIIKRHPDWEKYLKPKIEEYLVEINIPCPINENPSLIISLGEGEESPILGIGPVDYDWYYFRRMAGVSWIEWHLYKDPSPFLDSIDRHFELIISEQLILAEWKSGLKSKKYDLIDQEDYNELKNNTKIIKSISWLGKYNFNYNGEWSHL